jgi:hypothetical protein
MDSAESKTAVERMHNCSASFIEDIVVVERFGDKTVWGGTVSVFEIKGHPGATKAYAWSSLLDGSTTKLYYTVLHIPPVDSPEKAVKALIIRMQKGSKLL